MIVQNSEYNLESLLNNAFVFVSQGSNAAAANASPPKSDSACRHEFKLNEEIGIICSICGFVSTEIRDVSPPFVSQLETHSYKNLMLHSSCYYICGI